MNLEELLKKVSTGEVDVGAAYREIQRDRIDDLDFAKVDTDRLRRCGIPEVIFCPGKTKDQVVEIIASIEEAGQNVLATRATAELFAHVHVRWPNAVYHEDARCITLDVSPFPEAQGQIALVTAGTSDVPVAEEAGLVAERMGARVVRVYDVGVAGLHRLAPHLETLRASNAVVVVAGMEGALPSVVAGLIDKPVVAVPTSVGYGANLEGAVALLAMMNTCVPGVTVVNIDNGFGAGVAAALINRLGGQNGTR